MNIPVNKDTFNKIFTLVVASIIAIQVFHFDFLDLVLLLYFSVSLFFMWDGWIIFCSGIFLFILTILLKYSRPDFDSIRLETYRWWFTGIGAVLMLRNQIEKYWHSKGEANIRRFLFWGATIILDNITISISSLRAVPAILQRQFAYHYKLFCDRFSFVTRIKMISFFVIALVLLFVTKWEIFVIFFALFFLSGILFHLDSRVALMGAIVCIVAALLFLFLSNKSWSETFAMYAYYFLAIGIVEQIIEYRSERKINEART